MTNTVQLWHGELAEHSNLQQYQQLLDTTEQNQVNLIKNPLQQQRYIQSHGLLRLRLAEALNEKPQTLKFNKSRHGKPYLLDYPDLAFNMSHSGQQLLIGIAHNCRLGVDIEVAKPRTNLAGLVNKCFADTEADYWRQLPEEQKTPEFYRFWTAKEAFVKATGQGIALGLQHCVLSVTEPRQLISVPDAWGAASLWRTQELQLGASVYAALVVDMPTCTVSINDCTTVMY
ncbi:MAG: 4'-phosphopantetheinyl transferase superfamily protein [Methylococcales bacterium]